jgi:hypothetical protein
MAMTKIAYNRCFGGFGLSDLAIARYAEIKGMKLYTQRSEVGNYLLYFTKPEMSNDSYFSDTMIARSDPALIQAIEELGTKANGDYAQLGIRELEPGTKYRIHEYDGSETVTTIDEYEWEVA